MRAKMVIALVGAAIAFLAVPTLMDGQTPPGPAASGEILVRFNREVELAAEDSSSVVGGDLRPSRYPRSRACSPS